MIFINKYKLALNLVRYIGPTRFAYVTNITTYLNV